jgi:hypothetical protein
LLEHLPNFLQAKLRDGATADFSAALSKDTGDVYVRGLI